MKFGYKKISACVICLLAILSATFIFADSTSENAEVAEADVVNEAAFVSFEEPAYATIVPNDLTVTLQGNPQEAEYAASNFQDKVVAYVDEFLPVRTEPTRESETIGKMYPGCVADVIERGDVWSKIRSGNVEGYIQNIYVCFDSEAEDLAILLGGEEELITAITIEEEEAQKQELAKKAAEEAAAKKAAEEAARKAAEEAAAKKAAEEAARKAAEEAAQEAAQNSEAQTEAVETATEAPAASVSPYYMELSEEDIYLLACIVDWEANAEVYEGKLAVANVVLNRVRSGSYPNSVSGVIYQRGQFGGVLDSSGNYSTRWQARLANGPRNAECYQAAREAAAGNNNVIGYLYFNATRYCNVSSLKNPIIIGNQCFYQR